MLSEPGPSQKDAPGRVHSSGVPGAVRPTETESRRGGGGGGGGGGPPGRGFCLGRRASWGWTTWTVTQQREGAGHGSVPLKVVLMVDFTISNCRSKNL